MSAKSDEPWAQEPPPDATAIRRRLLRGGIGLAPILMESVPRSLLSGFTDTAVVPRIARGQERALGAIPWERCAGLTPDSWGDRWLAYEWPSEYERSGDHAVRFDAVFGEPGGYPGMSFLDVLQLSDDRSKDGVARLAVAAVLNAAKGLTPPSVFGLDIVRAMWLSFVSLGYCVPTPGVKWYANTSAPSGAGSIIQWLKSSMRR
jgi:hypothetical protein